MAQQSTAHTPNLISVISPYYCVPCPADVGVDVKDGNLSITDINGNMLFQVKGKSCSLHDRRVLTDAAGKPIATLRMKTWTLHDRWEVFRGESSEPNDLLFCARRSSSSKSKTKLHVFLANNKDEKTCNFRVEGSWSKRSCAIYAGTSSTVLAQMHAQPSSGISNGESKFTVTMYRNVDQAFVIALLVIRQAITAAEKVRWQVTGEVVGGVSGAIAGDVIAIASCSIV